MPNPYEPPREAESQPTLRKLSQRTIGLIMLAVVVAPWLLGAILVLLLSLMFG